MKAWVSALISLTVILNAHPASAIEPGVADPNPSGVTLGIAIDRSPPEGLNLGWRTGVSSGPIVDSSGNKVPNSTVNVWTTGPFLGWSMPRGWTSFLGASNFAFVNLPAVGVATKIVGENGYIGGFSDPILSPINLSWALGSGFFLSAGFLFNPPWGTISGKNRTSGVGQNFWTFEQSLAVGWHNPDYDSTVHAWYDIHTENTASHYRSGDRLFFDISAARKIGKFKFGPAATYANQVTGDANHGDAYGAQGCVSSVVPLCTRPKSLALGGIVGYNFGVANLTAWFVQDVYTRSAVRAWKTALTVGFKL